MITIWTNPHPRCSHSIWSHPHFTMAVAAQFFYVAAQAGIFSFFINYMTTQPPHHSRQLGCKSKHSGRPTPRDSCRAFFWAGLSRQNRKP